MVQVALIIGSNLDDKKFYLDKAKASLEKHVGNLMKASSVYISPPWGYESTNEYYNQVLIFESDLKPEHVLSFCLRIEQSLGRKRGLEGEYQDRTIDIDILYFGNEVVATDKLSIPHPRMHQRRFCLLPLFEVDPDWQHPTLYLNVQEMIDRCEDLTELRVLEG